MCRIVLATWYYRPMPLPLLLTLVVLFVSAVALYRAAARPSDGPSGVPA